MNTKKQTAVEWLYKTHFFKNGELTQEDFEHAKKIETERLNEVYDDGYEAGIYNKSFNIKK